MKILTAQISNTPALTDLQISKGFIIIDITIKSACKNGWLLSPTWSLVNDYKSGEISEDEYTEEYLKLIGRRWSIATDHTKDKFNKMNAILVCYCPSGTFCHRYIAADFLVKNMNAMYYGEHK